MRVRMRVVGGRAQACRKRACDPCRPSIAHPPDLPPTLSRVYGSPQLDALLDEGGAERLQELLQELRRACF